MYACFFFFSLSFVLTGEHIYALLAACCLLHRTTRERHSELGVWSLLTGASPVILFCFAVPNLGFFLYLSKKLLLINLERKKKNLAVNSLVRGCRLHLQGVWGDWEKSQRNPDIHPRECGVQSRRAPC